jgi:hypothetical protein
MRYEVFVRMLHALHSRAPPTSVCVHWEPLPVRSRTCVSQTRTAWHGVVPLRSDARAAPSRMSSRRRRRRACVRHPRNRAHVHLGTSASQASSPTRSSAVRRRRLCNNTLSRQQSRRPLVRGQSAMHLPTFAIPVCGNGGDAARDVTGNYYLCANGVCPSGFTCTGQYCCANPGMTLNQVD